MKFPSKSRMKQTFRRFDALLHTSGVKYFLIVSVLLMVALTALPDGEAKNAVAITLFSWIGFAFTLLGGYLLFQAVVEWRDKNRVAALFCIFLATPFVAAGVTCFLHKSIAS